MAEEDARHVVPVLGLERVFERIRPELDRARSDRRLELVLADTAPQGAPGKPVGFQSLPADWPREPEQAAVRAVLDQSFDVVFVLTPQAIRTDVVLRIAPSQLAIRRAKGTPSPCLLVLEKPIDANPSRARDLLDWIRTSDRQGRFLQAIVISHFLGKVAFRALADRYAALGRPPIVRAVFWSWEKQPMASTPSVFSEGTVAEHPIHSLVCLHHLVGVEAAQLVADGSAPLVALRYPGAVTTWDTAGDFTLHVTPSRGQPFPLRITHARLAPADVKILQIDLSTPAGAVTLCADLNRRKLSERHGRDRWSETAIEDGPDGYNYVIPALLGRSRLESVSVDVECAIRLYEPIYAAVLELRKVLRTADGHEYQERLQKDAHGVLA